MNETNVQVPEQVALQKKPKPDKKKWLEKGLSLICVVLAMILTFRTVWITVDGIKRSEVRTAKIALTEGIETGIDELRDMDEDDLDVLLDSEAFKSKADLRKWMRSCANYLGTGLSLKYSLSDTSRMLSFTTDTLDRGTKLYDSGENDSLGLTNLALEAESLTTMKLVNAGWILLLTAVGLLGIATAVFLFIPKAKAVKYVYFGMTTFLAIAVIAGVIAANAGLGMFFDAMVEMGYPFDLSFVEEMQLKFTAAPLFAAVFSFAPCIMKKLFTKKAKTEEI